MGTDYTVPHAAVLAAQLPRDSRCLRAVDPDLAWSDETALLASIHYLLRCVIWQLGGGKGDMPRPLQTPGEAREMAEQIEAMPSLMEEVADFLHIDIDGG